LRDIGSRIDTFITLIFTVVAVLFAGLGIVATAPETEQSIVNLPVWVAAVALWFALRAFFRRDIPKERWTTWMAFVVAIAGIIALDSLVFRPLGVRRSQEVFQKETQAREAAIGELRQASDAKLEALQQQINQLIQTRTTTK
jgi:hypothetical protein